MTFVLSLILTLAHAGRASRVDQIERAADEVAAAIFSYADQVNQLDARVRAGTLAPAGLRDELDRLARDLDDSASPARRLVDRAPRLTASTAMPTGWTTGDLVMIGVAALAGGVASAAPGGWLYHNLTAPAFDGAFGQAVHFGAAAGAGVLTAPLVILVAVETTRVILRGLRKVSGVLYQEQLREIFFARLARHGIDLNAAHGDRLAPHPSQFGGGLWENRELIADVAARLRADGVAFEDRGITVDPRPAMAEAAAAHGVLDRYPLLDLLTLGSKPILPGRCNSLLIEEGGDA